MTAGFGRRVEARPDADRLRRLADPATWQALFSSAVPAPGETPAWDGLQERLRDDGYAVAPGALAPAEVEILRRAHHAVRADGWPSACLLLLEPAWRILAGPSVRGVVRALLGPDVHQAALAWVHAVAAHQGARGWPPHQDEARVPIDDDGLPHRLTVWVAVTDATLDNGCIHVLPARACPELSSRFAATERWTAEETGRLLHHARALPAAAGTVMAWDPALLHWGGVATGLGAAARVAVSLEFVRAPADGVTTWMGEVPGWEERLALFKRALGVFAAPEREPEAARWADALAAV
ncbi:MAG: phytanoyl-CoA dioxygenase family protein [Deltaproteobacteria bacterium]|nr:phytanoyl-CoA dioxygenase family protein [Deltaproteobacteria bacterium]